MKYSEIQKLSVADRVKKVNEMKIELLKLNGQVATGTIPKSPGQIKQLKKSLARFKTLESAEKKSNK